MKVMDALKNRDTLTLTLVADDGTLYSTSSLKSAKKLKYNKSTLVWTLDKEVPQKVFNVAIIHDHAEILKTFFIDNSLIDESFNQIKVSIVE